MAFFIFTNNKMMPKEKNYTDVLVCVTGLTPQVVTETLYALAVSADSATAMVPEEIHVITTATGRARVELALLGQRGGRDFLGQFCRDYGLERSTIRFDAEHIHVIRGSDGLELDDITDEAGNTAAADQISRLIQRLTRDPKTRLHVSLAGGRKTMGFYLGYALSLYARPQDRLSHVLVNPPFESHPEFFYPPPRPKTLTVAGKNHYVSTADAQVRLAEIPFVRLRDAQPVLDGDLSFSEAVARAQQALDRPDLRIDLNNRLVYLQGQPVQLMPTHFAWLVWFADRAKRGLPPVRFDEHGALDLQRIIRWLEGDSPGPQWESVEKALEELRGGEKRPNYFGRSLSKLNSELRKKAALSPTAAARYQVRSFGRRPQTRYGLDLTPDCIRLEGEP